MTIVTKILSAFLDHGYRVLKVLRMGDKDVQEADECAPFGIDSNPVKGMDAIYADTLDNGEAVIIGYLNKGQLAGVGETRLYSTDADGNLKAFTWLKADGTYEILGSANHMTQYEGLQTAFNQLKSDFNSLVTLFNAHIHTGGTLSGNTGVPSAPGTSSAADITGAKITRIKTL